MMQTGPTVDIMYLGGLPMFGHTGSHPQFAHVSFPPHGYRFVDVQRELAKIPTWKRSLRKLGRLPRLLPPVIELACSALGQGASVADLIRFLRTRNLRAQLEVPAAKLAFAPSWPYFLGQNPWVLEIEDPTTLFGPFGGSWTRPDPRLSGPTGIYECGFFPIVKALLESSRCRGIICHVSSTARSLPRLFQNPSLAAKVWHLPLGVDIPPPTTPPPRPEKSTVTILFTNSWHQDPTSFYLRGGHEVLEAFSLLCQRYAHLRLIIRSRIPNNLPPHLRAMLEHNQRVTVMEQFLSPPELEQLYHSADIFALPSARLHVVSILQAMAYGMALVVSDGWGILEYVEPDRTALVVTGRYGRVSWTDRDGILREDYRPMLRTDPAVVAGLVSKISALLENPELRRSLGGAARETVRSRFSLECWNKGLKKILDEIFQREKTQ